MTMFAVCVAMHFPSEAPSLVGFPTLIANQDLHLKHLVLCKLWLRRVISNICKSHDGWNEHQKTHSVDWEEVLGLCGHRGWNWRWLSSSCKGSTCFHVRCSKWTFQVATGLLLRRGVECFREGKFDKNLLRETAQYWCLHLLDLWWPSNKSINASLSGCKSETLLNKAMVSTPF